MSRLLHAALPWLPWAAIAAAGLLDALNLIAAPPMVVQYYLVGGAVTITVAIVVRRAAAAIIQHVRAADRSLQYGVQLARELGGHAPPLPRAVGETTEAIPGALHVVRDHGTTYRATGDPAATPRPVAQLAQHRRAPSPRRRSR